jgi:hypothetical protein
MYFMTYQVNANRLTALTIHRLFGNHSDIDIKETQEALKACCHNQGSANLVLEFLETNNIKWF